MSESTLLTGMPGGWKVETPVSEEKKKVFEEALHGLVGVHYEPIAVDYQVINGMNYMYIAKATVANASATEGLAKLHIESSPAGSPPHLMDITPIVPWQ